MRNITFTAAALTTALALAMSANAYAGDGSINGAPTLPVAATAATSSPITENVGSHREPRFDQGYSVTITAGGILPTNGSNGIVQTANSLPSPAEIKGGWVSPEAYAAARGGYEQDNGHAFASRVTGGSAS